MSSVLGAQSDVNTFTKSNFHNICRVCFCYVKPPLLNIFSSRFDGESIADLITTYIPKQKLDISLPNNICKECLNRLVQFKEFAYQFHYADTLLTFIKDQLNAGNPEVKINNLIKPYIGALENKNEINVNSNSLPSCCAVAPIAANRNRRIISNGQRLKAFNAAAQPATNLNKAKSKSIGNLLNKNNGNKQLSLPFQRTCKYCEIQFLEFRFFKIHMKEKHADKIVKCCICSPMTDFFDNDELKRHKIASHNMVNCKKCNSLVLKLNMAKHEKLHAQTITMNVNKKIDSLDAQSEQKSLNTNNAVAEINGDQENHCKLHIISATQEHKPLLSYTETKCDNLFNYFKDDQYKEQISLWQETMQQPKTAITQHPKQDKSTAISTVKSTEMNKDMCCILCGGNMCFSSYTRFQKHLSNHHVDTSSCNICQTNILYSKEAFKWHRLYVHGFVVCHICLSTVKPENMQKHMEVVHSRNY